MLAAAESAAAEPADPPRREVSELVAEVSALEVGEEEVPYLSEETVLPPLEVVTIGWPLASRPRDLFLLAIGQPDALREKEKVSVRGKSRQMRSERLGIQCAEGKSSLPLLSNLWLSLRLRSQPMMRHRYTSILRGGSLTFCARGTFPLSGLTRRNQESDIWKNIRDE